MIKKTDAISNTTTINTKSFAANAVIGIETKLNSKTKTGIVQETKMPAKIPTKKSLEYVFTLIGDRLGRLTSSCFGPLSVSSSIIVEGNNVLPHVNPGITH